MNWKFTSVGFLVTKRADKEFSQFEIFHCLNRHLSGDWGDLCAADKKANEMALKSGDRIISSYIVRGNKLWIITEAENDNGIREYTTCLLPSEY